MDELIVLTFAGRKKYLEVLFKYILKYKKYITEYHIYLATNNKEDVDFIYEFESNNKDFVKVISKEPSFYESGNFDKVMIWYMANKNCIEDKVYLRIDDDVLFLDENLFTNFIDYRKKSTAPLVYPIILNNVISSPILQKYGKVNINNESNILKNWKDTSDRIKPTIDSMKSNFPDSFRLHNIVSQDEVLCPVSWGNFDYVYQIHNQSLSHIKNNTISDLYIDNISLVNYEPMSIQCCSWLGKDMRKYIEEFGAVGIEEEPWFAIFLPMWLNKPNEVFGGAIISHFSYWVQEKFLLSTNILSEYKKISETI